MNDVLGKALQDYHQGFTAHKLWIHNRYGRKELMPVATFFRSLNDLTALELLALEGCNGNILDIGAAAGCHSLILQQRNLNVTALDISPAACNVMRLRGVKKVIQQNIYTYSKKKFDTLLFLMNGIGIARTVYGLEQLLQHLKNILKAGGHILFDSSDVKYLFKKHQLPKNYYGEIDYRYEYLDNYSDWFTWLYIDKETMHEIALKCGFNLTVLFEEKSGEYLGRLKMK